MIKRSESAIVDNGEGRSDGRAEGVRSVNGVNPFHRCRPAFTINNAAMHAVVKILFIFAHSINCHFFTAPLPCPCAKTSSSFSSIELFVSGSKVELAILDKPLRRFAAFIWKMRDSARRRRIDLEMCDSSRNAPMR